MVEQGIRLQLLVGRRLRSFNLWLLPIDRDRLFMIQDGRNRSDNIIDLMCSHGFYREAVVQILDQI